MSCADWRRGLDMAVLPNKVPVNPLLTTLAGFPDEPRRNLHFSLSGQDSIKVDGIFD
jgi:hypothetical protein